MYFPVMSEDSRFDKKEVVIGAKPGKARAAVRKDFLRQRKVVSGTAGNSPLAFLYDPSLDEGRAFTTRVANEEVVVVPDEGPGRFRDRSSGSLLDANGRFVFGPLKGAELERVSSYDVMWFAWAAFFPETEVLG